MQGQSQSDTRREIRRFIEVELNRDLGAASTSDSLLEAGVLDSLGVMEVVGFIERSYGISVSDDEMMPENFETLDAIASFVDRRRANRD
jgi:acyl carrier protein